MRQVWEPTSRKSEDKAPLAGMERVRGVAYLVLSTAGEWILIVAPSRPSSSSRSAPTCSAGSTRNVDRAGGFE